MTLSKRWLALAAGALVGVGFAGCTERDQREAGREMGRAADEVREETRRAGEELREGASNVREGMREQDAEDDARR